METYFKTEAFGYFSCSLQKGKRNRYFVGEFVFEYKVLFEVKQSLETVNKELTKYYSAHTHRYSNEFSTSHRSAMNLLSGKASYRHKSTLNFFLGDCIDIVICINIVICIYIYIYIPICIFHIYSCIYTIDSLQCFQRTKKFTKNDI